MHTIGTKGIKSGTRDRIEEKRRRTGRRRARCGSGEGVPFLLAGAAAVVLAAGAALALSGAGGVSGGRGTGGSGGTGGVDGVLGVLRAVLVPAFLLGAPALVLALALRGLDPLGRALAAVGGALALLLLVAQGMLMLHVWSVRGGVLAVGALSLAGLALARWPRRAAGGGGE
ncbi:hypothetical protein ACQYWQ_04645 [Streptomyces sp. P6-2-1]|uniref:hypothetical protein n=1 Tax=unclassified Streptomyces TaxID=2593676 RepID=UPI003D363B99